MNNKINFNINEIAEDYIDYLKSKYNFQNETIDMINIRSNILKDCEFHIFEGFGLSQTVENILKEKKLTL